jgi:hypothetical protein
MYFWLLVATVVLLEFEVKRPKLRIRMSELVPFFFVSMFLVLAFMS